MATGTNGSNVTPPVVWHGFTQMSCYADNAPIIVERAEGRELIDVDGRRYLDAISSLWVTTLGHRVPELDEALARAARPGRPLDDARQRQPRRRSSSPRRSPRSCRSTTPHFLFASDGAAAVEQALKIAFQYWTNQGVHRPHDVPRVRRRLPRRHHRLAVGRRRRLRHRRVRPAALPGAARPGVRRPGAAPRRALIAEHATELAAVVVEPLVQGAAGHGAATRRRSSARRRGVPRPRRAADLRRGRHRLRPHRHAVRRASSAASRPDLMCLGKGLTGGYLPMAATVASRAGVRRLPRARTCRERTLYHGHSYSGNALGRGRGAPSPRSCSTSGTCWPTSASVPRSSAALLAERVAPLAGRGRGAPAGSDDRHRARPPGRRPAVGTAGVAPRACGAAC